MYDDAGSVFYKSSMPSPSDQMPRGAFKLIARDKMQALLYCTGDRADFVVEASQQQAATHC